MDQWWDTAIQTLRCSLSNLWALRGKLSFFFFFFNKCNLWHISLDCVSQRGGDVGRSEGHSWLRQHWPHLWNPTCGSQVGGREQRLYFGTQGPSPPASPSSCQQQLWGVPWVEGPRQEYLGAMVVWWSLGKSGVCLRVKRTCLPQASAGHGWGSSGWLCHLDCSWQQKGRCSS